MRGKNEEHVELLELGRSNIRVASYMTELPPKEVLEAKLRTAIEAARNRLCEGRRGDKTARTESNLKGTRK